MHIVLNMVVRNEEKRIGEFLALTLPLVDGVAIVDQESTDLTAEICRQFGITVLRDRCHGYADPSRQLAYDASPAGSWLLMLDADELLMPQFIAEMRTLDRRGFVGAEMVFTAWIGGEHHGDGDPHYRFARKENVRVPSTLHQLPMPVYCKPSQIYRPHYPAVMHRKSWAEQLDGELGYERLLEDQHFGDRHWELWDLSTCNLRKLRALGLTGADVDAMSISERRQLLGYGPHDASVHAL